MASTYFFYNSWKTLHFFWADCEQQFVACSVQYRLGRPFPLRTQSNEKNTPWHCRFEWKRYSHLQFLPVLQLPMNQDFVFVSFQLDQTSKTMIWQLLSKQCKTQMLHTVKHYRCCSSWFSVPLTPVWVFVEVYFMEITLSALMVYGYASRNWLYPSRFSAQRVMHTLKITFCCLG